MAVLPQRSAATDGRPVPNDSRSWLRRIRSAALKRVLSKGDSLAENGGLRPTTAETLDTTKRSEHYVRPIIWSKRLVRALITGAIACAVVSHLRMVDEISRLKRQISEQARQIDSATTLLRVADATIGDLRDSLSGERQNFESISRYANTLQLTLQKVTGESGPAVLADTSKSAGAASSVQAELEFHRQALGDGMVGLVLNASDFYKDLVVKAYRPRTGQQQKILIHLGPHERAEIGHLEGWLFESGDRVSVEGKGSVAKETFVP